jgi:hypothetical protein
MPKVSDLPCCCTTTILVVDQHTCPCGFIRTAVEVS